jgi:hypothetical protein
LCRIIRHLRSGIINHKRRAVDCFHPNAKRHPLNGNKSATGFYLPSNLTVLAAVGILIAEFLEIVFWGVNIDVVRPFEALKAAEPIIVMSSEAKHLGFHFPLPEELVRDSSPRSE